MVHSLLVLVRAPVTPEREAVDLIRIDLNLIGCGDIL